MRTSGSAIFPTLDYERCRDGIDDLRYLGRLERLVGRAKASGKAAPQRQAAETLLEKIAAGIADDWTAYTRGGQRFPADGFEVLSPEKAAGMGNLETVRRAVAECIVQLQTALP